MTHNASFHCYRESDVGRALRRVLMSQSDRMDRLPVSRLVPECPREAPDAIVDGQRDSTVTVVVLTQVERRLLT